jgi:hypothetical protein
VKPFVRHEAITGLVVHHTTQCWCGCCLLLVGTHSAKSSILVWRCLNCRKRRGEDGGKISAECIEELVSFYDRHGHTEQPLIWCDAFGGYFARGRDD